jgi:hypothetical protein
MIFQRPVVRARKPIRNRANPGCSGWRERSLFRRGSLGVEPLEERALLALLSVPGTFATIGLALAAAVPNVDTIEIDGGVYPEAVSVSVNVTLQAKPATGTVIADSFDSTAPTTVSLSGDFQASTVAGFNWLGPVNIVEDTTLTAAFASAPITFASTVQSPAAAKALTTNAAGAASFLGVVGGGGNELASLTIGANTGTLKNVTTAGVQNYTGAANVTLNGTYTTNDSEFKVAGPAILAGTTTINTGLGPITFNSTITGGGFNLTLSAMGTTTLGGAVSAVNTLTSNNTGDTVVNDTISTTTTLVMVDPVQLNGGSVITTGDQTYSNTITLGNPTVLNGANLTLATVLGGGFNLTLNGALVTTLGGVVSGVAALTSNSGGTTLVNNTISAGSLAMVDSSTLGGATVTTTANQVYTGTMTLGADTTLNGGILTLGAVVGAGFDLTLHGTGLTTLGGAVSGVDVLTSNSGSTTAVNSTINAGTLVMSDASTLAGGTVTTTGNQT